MKTFTNFLILLSIIFTIGLMIFGNNSILSSFGINTYYLDQGKYGFFPIQIFLSNFLHGGIFHLLSNSIALYYFGNKVENTIGIKKYILFFILSAIGIGLFVLFFSSGNSNTIGISGFCMAVTSFYAYHLWITKDYEFNSIFFILVLNVLFGLQGNISFSGHFSGAIIGFIFAYIHFYEPKQIKQKDKNNFFID